MTTVGSGTRATRCEGSYIALDPKDLKYSRMVRKQETPRPDCVGLKTVAVGSLEDLMSNIPYSMSFWSCQLGLFIYRRVAVDKRRSVGLAQCSMARDRKLKSVSNL